MFTTPDFTIFALGHGTFDIFTGNGWENWSRFQRDGRVLKLVKGQPLTKDLYETLCKTLKNG